MRYLRHFDVQDPWFEIGGNKIETKRKALLAAKLALERKAEDVSILDMHKVANFCDYFVVCSASSQRRGQAIADLIEETFDQHGLCLRSVQGKKEGMWILLDYSDIVIHIFFKDVRDYYALDRLWADAKRIHVPKDRTQATDSAGRGHGKLSR
jgi:ribosome-associated protein